MNNTTTYHRAERNFTIVSNELIFDKTLSCDAKMTMVYLLTKGDTCTINYSEIQRVLNLSRYRTQSAIEELFNAEYLSQNTE